MIAAILGALTSRIAGPVASTVALALGLLLLSTCTAKSAGERAYEKQIAVLTRQLAEATRDLGQCRTNTAGLTASLTAQNDAVEAARAAGAEMLAKSTKALSAAEAGRTAAEKRAAAIMAKKPVGADACHRALEADDLILGALK